MTRPIVERLEALERENRTLKALIDGLPNPSAPCGSRAAT
jgi:hypothetical protein